MSNQLPVAIKNGALARMLQAHLPNLQVIPSKTRTGEFPEDTVVIRPQRWEPQGMNDPEFYRAITLRFTLRNVSPDTVTCASYERKVHMDLAWVENGWALMPALASGFMPLEIYNKFQATVTQLISVIRNVAEQQKGS